jgi:hypothetical protein
MENGQNVKRENVEKTNCKSRNVEEISFSGGKRGKKEKE